MWSMASPSVRRGQSHVQVPCGEARIRVSIFISCSIVTSQGVAVQARAGFSPQAPWPKLGQELGTSGAGRGSLTGSFFCQGGN